MQTLRLKRHGNSLVPADTKSAEELLSAPTDRVLNCTLKIARNPQRHRLYWGLIGHLSEQSNYTKQAMHHFFKIATGEYTTMKVPGGAVKVPTSTAFDAMTEAEFCDYLGKMREILLHQIYPKLSEAEIWEIEKFFTPQKESAHA